MKNKSASMNMNLKISLLLVFGIVNNIFAQKKPDIRGNKSVAEFEKNLPAFHAIHSDEAIDFSLIPSNSTSVHFTSDDNLPAIFKFEVKDSVLHISTYYKIKSKKQLSIQISYNELDRLSLDGGKVKLFISDKSSMSINLNSKTQLEVRGSGELVLIEDSYGSDLTVNAQINQVKATLSAHSNLVLNGIFDHLELDVSERAMVNAKGGVKTMSLKLSDQASFEGAQMKSEETSVSLENHSHAVLYSILKVNASLTDFSLLDLYGAAQVNLIQFDGLSKIHKNQFKDTTN